MVIQAATSGLIFLKFSQEIPKDSLILSALLSCFFLLFSAFFFSVPVVLSVFSFFFFSFFLSFLSASSSSASVLLSSPASFGENFPLLPCESSRSLSVSAPRARREWLHTLPLPPGSVHSFSHRNFHNRSEAPMLPKSYSEPETFVFSSAGFSFRIFPAMHHPVCCSPFSCTSVNNSSCCEQQYSQYTHYSHGSEWSAVSCLGASGN